MQDNYFDLLIRNNNFVLNSGNEPELCKNSISIGQDVAHAIIESGLAYLLLAERSPTLRADIFTQIILLVEGDVRIIPGTVYIKEENSRRFLLTADTYDYGALKRTVDYEKQD
ncbi:DUF2590 family protein [Limnobaculum xujianqingii]|uniref:DUF2590 family protein n=1 Tax=Limnobaculum xujianqingii TaxID=2738837 RepID=UPI00112E5A75|nr:DUF2590 family protein [Limnobaculum xujianqingii]